MAGKPTATAASGPTRGYKRSWKNLLINKRYQLRFTLFMAGLAAVLIAALGYFVMFYADRTLTKTPITPADQAEAFFLLVSQRLSKTTGQIISVDGGLHEAFLR